VVDVNIDNTECKEYLKNIRDIFFTLNFSDIEIADAIHHGLVFLVCEDDAIIHGRH
jgi:hypothetical protein